MNVRLMARAALFASLMAVCAWISIPVPPVMLTLQTFALALSLLTLGGKGGSISIFLYLMLGAVGLPVFSGFRGGLASMLDVTGGFLWGFGLGALSYRLLERWGRIPGLVGFLLTCYLCGGLYMAISLPGASWRTILCTGVLPYLLPDAAKLTLALMLSNRLRSKI